MAIYRVTDQSTGRVGHFSTREGVSFLSEPMLSQSLNSVWFIDPTPEIDNAVRALEWGLRNGEDVSEHAAYLGLTLERVA